MAYKVLIAHAYTDQNEIIQHELLKLRPDAEVKLENDMDAIMAQLLTGTYDVAAIGYLFGDLSGLRKGVDIVRTAKQAGLETRIVMISGSDVEREANEAGVDLYLDLEKYGPREIAKELEG